MTKRRDPERIDDEAPEWTSDDFRRARSASDVLPELFGPQAAAEMLKPKRGRPVAEQRKEQVSLRIDPDVINAFRATGPGWQTRINQALKVFLNEHSASELDRP